MMIMRVLVAVGLLVGSLAALSCSKGTSQGTQATTIGSSSPVATNSPGRPASTTTTASNATPAPQNSNALTEERVHAVVQKAFNKLVRSNQMAPGAGSKVIGIQELPGVNGARADLDLTNAAFLQTDMLSGKWELGPGGYGGRMVYSKKRIRIDHCTANLKHYNNGKWVLESLDTHSYEFGVVTVNVGLD